MSPYFLQPSASELLHTKPLGSTKALYWDSAAGICSTAQAYDAFEAVLRGDIGYHEALEQAHTTVAELLGCEAKAVCFLSAGSQANAYLLQGMLRALATIAKQQQTALPHVITSQIEHASVRRTLQFLAQDNCIALSEVAADFTGQVRVETILKAIRPETKLISLVAACNETGVLQPLKALRQALLAYSSRSIGLHSDAVQLPGHEDLSLCKLGVDAMAISGHKFGAVGGTAVVVRNSSAMTMPWQEPYPLAGEEKGCTAELADAAGALSLAVALKAIQSTQQQVRKQQQQYQKEKLEKALVATIADLSIVGCSYPRLSHISCLHIEKCPAEALQMALDVQGISVSTGSACSSGVHKPSEILLGMGFSKEQAQNCIRLSFVNTTQEVEPSDQQIDLFVSQCRILVQKIRSV